jgi:hypothetical protein
MAFVTAIHYNYEQLYVYTIIISKNCKEIYSVIIFASIKYKSMNWLKMNR